MDTSDFLNIPATELVEAATRGTDAAWNALVSRYQPLVNAVCGRFRLSSADTDDVSQALWLRLFEHINRLRDPRALPGWIQATTRNLCLNTVKQDKRCAPHDPLATYSWMSEGDDSDEADLDQDLVKADSCDAVRRGLAGLPSHQQDLLLLLVADPPLSYKQISERMRMPVGSIGPTRARCLTKLAESAPIRALIVDESSAYASA